MTAKTTTIAPTSEDTKIVTLTDKDIAVFSTVEEIMAHLTEQGASVIDISEFGDGAKLVHDKDKLVGRWMMILKWKLCDSDKFGGVFSVIHAILKDNTKIVFTDGGAGVNDQLQTFTAMLESKGGPSSTPFVVPDGLTRSDYTKVDSNGEEFSASTYYLSLATDSI